jgi:hypothetical protein
MFTTAFSPSLTEKGNKFVFRATISDAITGAQVMDFAVKELKYKKIGIMGSDGDYGQGGAIAAAKQLEKLGIPAVARGSTALLKNVVRRLREGGILAILPDGDLLISVDVAGEIAGLADGPNGSFIDDSDIIRFRKYFSMSILRDTNLITWL